MGAIPWRFPTKAGHIKSNDVAILSTTPTN